MPSNTSVRPSWYPRRGFGTSGLDSTTDLTSGSAPESENAIKHTQALNKVVSSLKVGGSAPSLLESVLKACSKCRQEHCFCKLKQPASFSNLPNLGPVTIPPSTSLYPPSLSNLSNMAGQKKKTNTNGANNKNTRIRDMTGFLPPGVPASCGVFETPRSGAQLLIAFLNLPVELRNKIYEHALLSDLDKDFIAKPNNGAGCHVRCEVEGPKSKGTGLFRVSRQISFESTTYFYSQLKFEIEDRPYCKNQSTYRLNADNNAYQPSSLMDFKPFLLAIGEQNCASIRHLKINLTRLRTVEDRTRRYSGFGTRFLTDPLELLARSNCLRTLEINIDLQGGLDTFTSNDRIIKELHKFSGIQTVKITGQDSTRFREGAKKRATKLEKEISNIPSSKSSKATMQLFGPQKADISPAVRNAKKYGLVLARKLEARQELVEQQEAVDDLHKVFEEKCKNVGMALEQMKEDITQYDLDLEEATKEVLANAQRAREAHAVEYALYN